MAMNGTHRRRLARLLARHLTSWEDRASVASSAGLRDVQVSGRVELVWNLLIDEAVSQGKLDALLRAAAARKPEVVALSRLAAKAQPHEVAVPVSAYVAGGLGLVALMVCVVVYQGISAQTATTQTAPLTDGSAVVADQADVDSPHVVTPAAAPEPSAAPEPPAEPAPSAEPEPPAEPAPSAAPEPSAEPERAEIGSAQVAAPSQDEPKRVAAPTPEPSRAPARVTRHYGPTCDGWLYAGRTFALEQGAVWVLDEATNVRADYPSRDNGWSLGAKTGCIVLKGARVSLDGEIARIPGGVWVRVTPHALER